MNFCPFCGHELVDGAKEAISLSLISQDGE